MYCAPKLLSIIVPVYNGEQHIARCVSSIVDSPISLEYEVIAIDDGSTDRTPTILKSLPCKYYRIEQSGVAKARNKGINEASGDVLLFFDADTYVTNKTINSFIEIFRNDENVAIAQGKWVDHYPSANFNTKFHLAKWTHNFEQKRNGKKRIQVSELMTGCLGVRKEVFKQIGLFDEGYKRSGGEEWELGFRAINNGIAIYYYDNLAVFHDFGPLRSTVRKTFFRTINFSMLMFQVGGNTAISFHDVDNSVPKRDKINLVNVTLLIVTTLGLLLNLLVGQNHKYSLLFAVLLLVFFGVYLHNLRDLLRYIRNKEGYFFTLRSIGADFVIILQKILGIITAGVLFFVLKKKNFKI